MSKRFGRNQRRRAREELAAAIADSNWHQSRASHLQNELWQVNLINTRMRIIVSGKNPSLRVATASAPGPRNYRAQFVMYPRREASL